MQYERHADDPRIEHELVLAVDPFGHPTRTASAAYPRRVPRAAGQEALSLLVTEHDLRNDDLADRHRLGIPIETRTYALEGVEPAGAVTPAELDASPATARRLLERTLTIYHRDDLAAALPAGSAGRRALVQRTLRATFTPALVADALGAEVTLAVLTNEGGYEERDGLWWAPSERTVPDPARFFRSTATIDPFGNRSELELDAYALLPVATGDALGNRTTARHNYRVLAPWLVTDANGNRTGTRYDALGFVSATAVLGKAGAGEGDVLDETSAETAAGDDPTSTVAYDVGAFAARGEPVSVRTRAREQHRVAASRRLETVVFYDGSGREVMTKTRAEPGPAPARHADGTLERDAAGRPVLRDAAVRWAATGRTAYDNKGNAIRQHDPFFSADDRFEPDDELAGRGGLVTLRHDALGRVVRTERADGTFSRSARDAWTDEQWDENDTVLDSAWYLLRSTAPVGTAERRAADLTERHARTPSLVALDPRGRPVANIAHAGFDAGGAPVLHTTRTRYDAQGRLLTVTDPRGIAAVRQEHDMTGQLLVQGFADAGTERRLVAADGARIRTWSATGAVSAFALDPLRRALTQTVTLPDGTHFTAERTEYGESLGAPAAARNLRGRRLRTWDAAGLETILRADFAGNILAAERRFVADHRVRPDWAGAGPALEAEAFITTTEYDALGRVTQVLTPDNSLTRTTYDRGGQIAAVGVRPRGTTGPWVGVLDTAAYDARGRRERTTRGSIATVYRYEPETGRLTGVRTVSGGAVVQDLSYTHDPVGNVLQVADAAQQTVFFANAAAAPGARFELDPLYRLVLAEGREHQALGAAPQYDPDDAARSRLAHPHDGTAMLRYAESYAYDDGGNLTELVHRSGGPAGPVRWRRRHRVADDSNQLLGVNLPGDGAGPPPVRFAYDVGGALLRAPHLDEVRCDHRGRMTFARGGAQELRLAHDAAGARVRKVVERNGGAIVEDRRYVGSWEIVRRRTAAGVEAASETLRVPGGDRCVAQFDTELVRAGAALGAPAPELRLQFHDHLLSAALELNAAGAVLTYEEHHPYGGTAYQGGRSVAQASLKRYRYLACERDEVTGFVACAARPYAPWLGRFLFPDPAGAIDGSNLFRYARNNPLRLPDPGGTQSPMVAAYPTLAEGLKAFETLADSVDAEIGLAHDTLAGDFKLFQGGSKSVDMGAGSNVRLAHSHISDPSSTPSDADLVTIRDQVRNNGPREHLIVRPQGERTLVTASRNGSQMRAVTFEPNGEVSVLTQAEDPWQMGKYSGEFREQGPSVRLGRVRGALERVRAELRGGPLGAAAAKTGSTLRTGALAVGKGLAVLGAAAGGWQVGTGINQMMDARTRTEGAINAGEGAANLGLSIGVAIAVKAKILVAEAGIAAGGTAALAGVAAAGSVALLAETGRAAAKGEMTPIDVADKYYGSKLGDLTSYLPSSFMDKAHNAFYEAFLK